MKKLFYAIRIRLDYAARAWRQISEPHIGQKVVYNGEPCTLINGANHPYWRVMPTTPENLARSKRTVYERVHPNDFIAVGRARRYWTAFTFHYKFWMGYWYSVDLRKLSQ